MVIEADKELDRGGWAFMKDAEVEIADLGLVACRKPDKVLLLASSHSSFCELLMQL